MKRFFSGKLWFEGVRRLRLMGFLTLGLCSVEALLVPLVYYVSGYGPYSDETVSGLSAHPAVLFVFLVAAPVMTLITFSFLNKRRRADFYHALPFTRLSTFVSLFASVLTWLFGTVVVSSLISAGTNAALGQWELVAPVFRMMPGVFAASFLMCAGVALGTSVTGTLFSNISVSALILYLPGFFAAIFNAALSSEVTVLAPGHYPLSFIGRLNLLVAYSPLRVFALMEGEFAPSLETPGAWAYTAALAAVYAVLAAVAFCRRKSETAERPAPSGIINAIYRTAVTMFICIPICALIFTDLENEIHTSAVFYVILYTVALTAWILWDLITSKSWKKVLKALSGLFVVIGLNVLLVLSLIAAKNAILAYEPAPADVSSVTMISDSSRDDTDMAAYARGKVGHGVVTDRRSVEILTDALSETVRSERDGTAPRSDYQGGRGDTYSYVTARFSSPLGVRVRRFRIASGDLGRVVYESEDDAAPFSVILPRANFVSVTEVHGYTDGDRIFKAAREELKEADPKAWYEFTDGYASNNTPGSNIEMRISLPSGSGSGEIRVPLSTKFTPRAIGEIIAEIKNDDTADAGWLSKVAGDASSGKGEKLPWCCYNCYLCDPETGLYSCFFISQSEIPPLTDEDFRTDEIVPGDSFMQFEGFDPETGESKKITVALTDEGIEKFKTATEINDK